MHAAGLEYVNTNLEFLPLAERKASFTVLLTPLALLVRVADHHVLISVSIKTRVHMHSDLLVIWANIQSKTAAQCNKKVGYILILPLLLF